MRDSIIIRYMDLGPIFPPGGGGGGGVSGDLQSVCDIGSNTNTGIQLNGNGLTVSNPVTGGANQFISFQENQYNQPSTGFNLIVTYPPILSADQVIQYQDGSGFLAFLSDVSTGNLQAVTDNGYNTTNDIQCNTIQIIDVANGGYAIFSCQDGALNYNDTGAVRSFNLDYSGLTPATLRTYSLPNRDGTLALLSDIPAVSIEHRNYTAPITVGAATLVIITTGNPTYVGGITPKNAETAANFYNTLGYSIAYGTGRFTITFYIGTGVIGTTWDFDCLISFR